MLGTAKLLSFLPGPVRRLETSDEKE